MFIMYSFGARADWNQWPESTKTLFVASQVAITADWITTRNGLKDEYFKCNCFYETNPLLGPSPSVEVIDLFFVGSLVINYLIVDYISTPFRRDLYLSLRTIFHARAAINNQKILSAAVRVSF